MLNNQISFNYLTKSVNMNISEVEIEEYKRFYHTEVPLSARDIIVDLGTEREYVWVSPCIIDPRKVIKINLKLYPAIARYWYSWRIYNYLKERVPLIRHNFMEDVQYWELLDDDDDITSYKKYNISIVNQEECSRAKVLFNYHGISYVVKRDINDLMNNYQLDTHMIKEVVFDGQVYDYNHLPERAKYQWDKIYPVLTSYLANIIGITYPVNSPALALTDDYNNMNNFYERHINRARFKKIIPFTGGWDKIKKEQVYQLTNTSKVLEFGERHTSANICEGIREYGPARLITENHIKIFLIYCKEHHAKAMMVKDHIIGNKGMFNMRQFTRIQMAYDGKENIVLEDTNNIVNIVQDRIHKLIKMRDTSYFVFYISPFSKSTKDENKCNVDYLIKELLLKRDMMSQTIDSDTIREEYFINTMANIGIAMIAKLEGKPWQLADNKKKELIVSIGAFSSGRNKGKYITTAYCFDNKGLFERFDYWPATDAWLIHGTIMSAIDHYRKLHKNLRRVIVHYYKPIDSKEFIMTDMMIDDINISTPVIVVKIENIHRNKELVVDTKNKNMLPHNGCYIKLNPQDYLLYINDNNDDDSICNTAPMPIKLHLQANIAGYLNNEIVKEIMQEIYDFTMLHWQSTKQSRLPITIAYLEKIAEIVPYFFTETIPVGMKDRLWFL